ncbi:hypothetical protein DXG01_001528 [Tephrocybe rancida]|nr:hypothetical protein DXG01_001528 [Tephrocybe rancida]
MISLSASDLTLLDKLENVAGITNQDILSDDEILRGRTLLKTYESLHRPEADASLRILRLHIALAPHKRLPEELMKQIFLVTSDSLNHGSTILTPSAVEKSPWVLGRVCSAWRHLSRSMAELWGTASITIDESTPVNLNLNLAIQTLPAVCKVSVEVNNAYQSVKDVLVPHLSRINKLTWKAIDYPEDVLWDLLPSYALSQMKLLEIHVPREKRSFDPIPTGAGPGCIQLFGSSARLESLRLVSDTPNLLFDLPWRQLTSFTLITASPEVPAWALSKWIHLRDTHPFSHDSRLQSLYLASSRKLLPVILSFDLPWQQLTTCTIHCQSESDLCAIFAVLPHCVGLLHLGLVMIRFRHTMTHANIILPSPESLKISGHVPTCLIEPCCLWGNVRKLYMDLPLLTYTEFCDILAQCRSLKQVTCALPERGSMPTTRDVVLGAVEDLNFFNTYETSIFPRLAVPAVTVLLINGEAELDLCVVSECIRRSKCKLKCFAYAFIGDYQVPHGGIRELLSELADSTLVDVSRVVAAEDVLSDIASGKLLPRVHTLRISTPTFEAFASMIEARLKMEMERGPEDSRIQVITGSAPVQADDSAQLYLKKVSDEYGVFCYFSR